MRTPNRFLNPFRGVFNVSLRLSQPSSFATEELIFEVAFKLSLVHECLKQLAGNTGIYKAFRVGISSQGS